MQAAVPNALAPAYTDDTAAAGKAVHNVAFLSFLLRHGPMYGYFSDPGKSWYITARQKMRRPLNRHSRQMTWTSSTLTGRDTWVASSGAMQAK